MLFTHTHDRPKTPSSESKVGKQLQATLQRTFALLTSLLAPFAAARNDLVAGGHLHHRATKPTETIDETRTYRKTLVPSEVPSPQHHHVARHDYNAIYIHKFLMLLHFLYYTYTLMLSKSTTLTKGPWPVPAGRVISQTTRAS